MKIKDIIEALEETDYDYYKVSVMMSIPEVDVRQIAYEYGEGDEEETLIED